MQTDDRQGQVLTGRHRGKRGRRYLRVTAEWQGDAGETRAQRIAALFARQVCHFDEAAYRVNLIPDSHHNNRRDTMKRFVRNTHAFAYFQGLWEHWSTKGRGGRTHPTDQLWNEAYDTGMNHADWLLDFNKPRD
jgi:hypothetical protein